MLAIDEYGRKLEISEPVVSPEYKLHNVLVGYYSSEPVDFNEWVENPENWTLYPHKAEVTDNQDGKIFKPFCKVWTVWDKTTKRHYPVRVGLGAYGDLTVWHRQVKPVK